MDDFATHVIALFETIHPLDRIQRAGWVLRGVPFPESVAAHSHFVTLMTLLLADRHPDMFDRGRALAMAALHDLAEARLMDIPMPSSDAYFKGAKEEAEEAVFEEMFEGFPPSYAEMHRELREASSPEARLVRGLDKAQMMVKVLMYERDGCDRLGEFWSNPRNFDDHGLKPVSDLFDAICARAGKPRPKPD